MQENTQKNVNTFSVSHSKHIHQPAMLPRLIYRRRRRRRRRGYKNNNKKNNNNPVMLVKLRPFPFRFNAILHREEEEEDSIWSLPNPNAGLFVSVRTRKPQSDRNPLPVLFFIIISSTLFLRFNKSALPFFLLNSRWIQLLSSAPKSH